MVSNMVQDALMIFISHNDIMKHCKIDITILALQTRKLRIYGHKAAICYTWSQDISFHFKKHSLPMS